MSNRYQRWLTSELLRLRSFDWGPGLLGSHYRQVCALKDGVAKFKSRYGVKRLSAFLELSDDALLEAIDSDWTKDVLEEKGFTLSWDGDAVAIGWIGDGIQEYGTTFEIQYFEEEGCYFVEHRRATRIVYVDGQERVIEEFKPTRAELTPEEYRDATQPLIDPPST